MKFVSIPLSIMTALSSYSAFAGNQSGLATEAENAIYEFFDSSSRKVQSVELESFSRLHSPALDYLVEAEVRAQSPVNSKMIDYHCGVFLKRVTYQWQAQQTVCEALPQNNLKLGW